MWMRQLRTERRPQGASQGTPFSATRRRLSGEPRQPAPRLCCLPRARPIDGYGRLVCLASARATRGVVEGKSSLEALRALKRHISNAV
jgi:hypothetical protein